MAGRNTEYDMTYLTPATVYRHDIDEADQGPLLNAHGNPIAAIRVDINVSKKVIDAGVQHAPKYEVSAHGYNAQLMLYVHLDLDDDRPYKGLEPTFLPENSTKAHANIKVWGWSAPDNNQDIGRWCLVHEQSVVDDTLIVVRDIPNTKYVVSVSELVGATVAEIIEQHTV